MMQQMMQQSAEEAQQRIKQICEHERLWERKAIEREHTQFDMAQFHAECEIRERSRERVV